ncbi:hypothetical protein [Methylobacterium segetis]|uniref:hypothetical protein n=1 Tax=Methylobacterium segetis TaxID=2488750 RepID=UPI001047E502|nr:hypothetical protein [Methylobacterium segetis]
MTYLTQENSTQVLQAAWIYAQEERERTGAIIELRLTTLGLTALNTNAICTRIATVSCGELARSEDLPRLFAKMIRQVSDQQDAATSPFASMEKLAA